jgi:3-hydroxybutyryl-CoA dehydrogenase
MIFCVCGAGTMGCGIAQAAAQQGISTILFDIDSAVLNAAEQRIQKNLSKLAEQQKIQESAIAKISARVQFTNHLEDCVADIILEAIVEKLQPKINLFKKLFELNAPATVFVTNTSSLSVHEIAEQLPDPTRVAGMHFFNPPTVMKLVEIVTTVHASESTIDAVRELAQNMGKTPVLCKDAPGFIVNHVARPFYLEALRIYERGMISTADIDQLVEASGFRMGPFRLMDLIGNDINYAVSCSVYDALGQPERLKPSSIQEEKVRLGELGRKSGKGYYTYSAAD